MNALRVSVWIGAGVTLGLLLSPMSASARSARSQQQPQAQSQPAEAPGGNQSQRLAPGSIIPIQLIKTIDAKKVKVGDEVVAKVTQDLKRQDGQIVIPKDTEILGRVTEAQARTKEEKESQLGLAFDRAVLRNGGNVTLPMSIQAVIGTQNPENNNTYGEGMGQPSAPSGGSMQSPSGRGGMGSAGTNPMPPPSAQPTADSGAPAPSNSQRPPITADTQGVIGLKDVQLSAVSDGKQGSVLTSARSNVKLESGTLMLLRVTQ